MVTGAGRQLDRLAGAGQVVGALAVDLDGRIGRRDLDDLADEARQHGVDLGERRPHVGLAPGSRPRAS